MKLIDIKTFLFGTLRGRLILSVAAVHAVMMTLFIIDLTIRQREMLLDRQKESATALSQSLSTSAAEWIAAKDISGLQEIVEAQRRYPEIIYVIFTDEQGHILAHTDKSKMGQYLIDNPAEIRQTILNKTPELVDTAVPAILGGKHVGWVRVGLGMNLANEKLIAITSSGILYALAAILIGSFIAWFMGRRITKRLYAVQDTINEVEKGNSDARSNISGTDEAASIAREFNRMLDVLNDQAVVLTESESKYRSLIQKIQAAVVVHGRDTRIITSNPLAQKLLGLTEEQMLGKTGTDLGWHFFREDGSIMPAEEYPVNNVISTHQALKNFVVKVHRSNTQNDVWVLVNADPVFDEEEEIIQVIVTFIDITERKESEEALKQASEEIRDLYNHAPCGYHSLNGEGVFVRVNDTELEWLGYGREEVLEKMKFMELLTSGSKDSFEKYFHQLKTTGTVRDVEFELIRKDRSIFPVLMSSSMVSDDNGNFLMSRATVYDITERRRAEEAHHEKERMFRNLVENSPDIIARYDLDCKRIYVNPEYLKTAMISKQELLSTSPVQRSPLPANSAVVLQNLLRRVLDSGVAEAVDLIWPKADNIDYWYNVFASPEFDREGHITGVMTISRDITERKRAEEALKDAAVKYRIVADNTYDWEFWLGPAGEFVYISPSCKRITGYDAEEFRTDPDLLRRIIYKDDTSRFDGHRHDLMLINTPGKLEYRIVHSDGSIRWLDHVCQPVFDEKENFLGTRGSNRDITERKRAEEAMYRLNRELRAVSSCNQTLLRVMDEQALLNEICRIICEEAGYKAAWVGYVENDTGKTVRPVACSGIDAGYLKNIKLSWSEKKGHREEPAGIVVRSGEILISQDFETDSRTIKWKESCMQRNCRSGIVLPLKDENSKVFGVLLIFSTEVNIITTDEIRLLEELIGDLAFGITALRISKERKRVEEALRNSEEKLRTIFDTMEEALSFNELIRNDEGEIVDYRVLEVNPAFEKESGLTHEKAVGKKGTELYGITSEYINTFWKKHLHDVSEVRTDFFVEKTQTWKHISTSIPIDNKFVISFFDITERKKAEEEIIIAKEKAEEMNRLKTNFFANMSHELRTPFVGIMGYAELLKESLSEPDSIEIVNGILSTSKRLVDTLSKILDLTRIEFEKTIINNAQIDIAVFLEDICKQYAAVARIKSVLLEKHIHFQPFTIISDQRILDIIFGNLINNAIKFTDMGRIDLDAYRSEEDGNEILIIKVKDTGIGIPKKKQELIWEEFRQASEGLARNYQGTGLGLAITKKYVELLGGKISVESEEGAGSIFTVELPFAESKDEK